MGPIEWMRTYPLRLYALMSALLIPYFALILLYPTAGRSRDIFFLPALILGQIGFILVLIAVGFVLSAVFYAQKTGKTARGYSLFAVTVVWMFALVSFGRSLTIDNGVLHEHSLDYGDRTYHVAYSPTPLECSGSNTCTEHIMVYECNAGGWFCNVIGREIPVRSGNGVYLRVVQDGWTALQVAQFDGSVVFERRDWVCRLPEVCESKPLYNALVE